MKCKLCPADLFPTKTLGMDFSGYRGDWNKVYDRKSGYMEIHEPY